MQQPDALFLWAYTAHPPPALRHSHALIDPDMALNGLNYFSRDCTLLSCGWLSARETAVQDTTDGGTPPLSTALSDVTAN